MSNTRQVVSDLLKDGSVFSGSANNILVNGGMEVWQRGNSFSSPAHQAWTADRWRVSKSGTPTFTVDRNASIPQSGLYAFELDVTVTNGTDLNIYQSIENYNEYKGKTISVSVRMRADVAARIRFSDSVSSTIDTHTGDDTWQTLTVTQTVSTSATSVTIGFGFPDIAPIVGTVYVDSVMMVVGSSPVDFVPADPAIELMRCQRYYELGSGINEQNVMSNRTVSAIRKNKSFKMTKNATPTITLNVTAIQWHQTPETGTASTGNVVTNYSSGGLLSTASISVEGFTTRFESGTAQAGTFYSAAECTYTWKAEV